jgi:hypothetical protein
MNTRTDTPTPLHATPLTDLSTHAADKPRRVEVPTVEDDDNDNELPDEGADALQNMWQRNSY